MNGVLLVLVLVHVGIEEAEKMNIICVLFGHNWRWSIAYQYIICIRCRKLHGGTLSEFEAGKNKVLKAI